MEGALTTSSISIAHADAWLRSRLARYAAGIEPSDPHVPTPQPAGTQSDAPASAALRLLRGFGFVVLFLLVQILAGTVLAVTGLSPGSLSDGDVSTRDVLAICLLETCVLAAALVLMSQRGWFAGMGLDLRGALQARGWWQLAPVGLLVIAPSVLLAATDDSTPVLSDMANSTMAAFVALAVLIAVAEELWFRGLLMSALEPARSPWFAVFGSAVLFGLPHVFSTDSLASPATALNAAAVTLAIAIPFACVRVASRSIVPLIGWHTAIDVWAFLHTASITAEGSPDVSDAAAALVIPALVATGYIVWLDRKLRGRAHSTQ